MINEVPMAIFFVIEFIISLIAGAITLLLLRKFQKTKYKNYLYIVFFCLSICVSNLISILSNAITNFTVLFSIIINILQLVGLLGIFFYVIDVEGEKKNTTNLYILRCVFWSIISCDNLFVGQAFS